MLKLKPLAQRVLEAKQKEAKKDRAKQKKEFKIDVNFDVKGSATKLDQL